MSASERRGRKRTASHPRRPATFFSALSLYPADVAGPGQRRRTISSSAYENGLITNADIVGKFEAAVAERLQVKHCIAVSSCTSGLMMSLRGLGVTGEVIIPSFTFFATGHSARWNGLTPVFADCDPDTWNVDVADVERKITERTRALLIVHLYGNPANVEALTKIAQKHNLKLIFDGAHAFGSQYQGKPIGSFGDAEVFSLSPTKLLVAGEGGLVTTNDASLAKAIRLMRNYGDSGSYDPDWIGMNARMSEFNAALGLTGLAEVDDRVRRRNQIARMYDEQLAEPAGPALPEGRPPRRQHVQGLLDPRQRRRNSA